MDIDTLLGFVANPDIITYAFLVVLVLAD